MTDFVIGDENISEETTVIDDLTDTELLDKRKYLYGTYRNNEFLNKLDDEIRARGLGDFSWQSSDKADEDYPDCPEGFKWNNIIRLCVTEAEWDQFMEDKWYGEDTEDEYNADEVNTSYDQDQPIGDEPQALNTELSNSEPIDAKTGQDFLDVNLGEESYGMSPDIMTDNELIEGRNKLKGGFQSISYLNSIEMEMRERGIEGSVKDVLADVFSGDWIYTKEEMEQLKKLMGEESLNQDGSGVARATRGVNPNSAKHKVLRYIYVSKSDCDICKKYDGHSYAIDSPNRPIIPRLESQGSKGSRPYTHPHCKCKWVNVFSDQESLVTEVDAVTMDRARQWYNNNDFDDLKPLEQKMIVIAMLKQKIGMEKNAEEDLIDPMPLVSMATIAFNALKPIIKNKFVGEAQAFHGRPDAVAPKYGIQNMLDKIVENTLGKEEKKEIAESEELNVDFSLDTLLGLIADRLANKIGRKLGVESKSSDRCESCKDDTNDPDVDEYGYMSCKNCDREQGRIEDWGDEATEGGKGSGRKGHQKWMLTGESGDECSNCMMITDKNEDGTCFMCGK